MSKKLKIKFVKFEKALAMQILEQEGSFQDSVHVNIGMPELCYDVIYICDEEERGNSGIFKKYFNTNAERDEYLKCVIRWISEEQFAMSSGRLEVGKMCEVRDCDYEAWERRKLIAILPKKYKDRFIVEKQGDNRDWMYFNKVRPLMDCIEPTIDGDVYTWEM